MMSSREWAELISREFSCSMATAKEMYHLMCCAYKTKQLNADVSGRSWKHCPECGSKVVAWES